MMPQNSPEVEPENTAPSTRRVFGGILRNVFKGEAVTNPPWPRMILCTIATLLPLLVGFAREHLPFAVFGSLTGYLLALNDHLGSLKHRLWVTTLSFFILCAGFYLGQKFQGQILPYSLSLAAVSYWLGLLGGEGAELERAVLFALIGFITAFDTIAISSDLMGALLLYASMAFGCLILGGPILFWIGRHAPMQHAGLRQSLRLSLTMKYERHLYAVCFTLIVLISVWFAHEFKMQHGSWITITVLIILRPDRMLTVYKTFQRFFGTIAGVLVADFIVVLHPPVFVLIATLGVCAFVIPWLMLKNYWQTSFLVTVFVVLLLELGTGMHGSLEVGTMRIEATFIGCAFSLVGVGLTRFVDRLLKRLLKLRGLFSA